MAKRVSVVMPVHNAEAYLGAAIASVAALRWPDLELVAVDDGSTDGSAAILAEASREWTGDGRRMVVLTQANRGAGAARNAGIAAAEGELILLADADDLCDPELLAVGIGEMDGSTDLVVARCRYTDAAGSVTAEQGRLPARPTLFDLLCGMMINAPLVRREAIRAIGGHDESLPGSIDLDLFVRLAIARPGALRALPQILSSYRRRPGQITADWRRMESTWTAIVDKTRAAGHGLSRRQYDIARGRHCVYWATVAYQSEDYAAARRLMSEAARRVPGFVVRDDLARIRALACLASLMPEPIHGRLRDAVNARRVAT